MKTITITFIILSAILFTACGKQRYFVKPNTTQQQMSLDGKACEWEVKKALTNREAFDRGYYNQEYWESCMIAKGYAYNHVK